MQAIRQIYQDAPSVIHINIPEELRHQTVEVIIPPQEEIFQQETNANCWPIGFFEQTFGSIPDFPDREWQGDYEEREPLA